MTEPACSEQTALVQRIKRFLAGLERAKRQPNRREVYHLRDALELLEGGRVREAETAFIKAEHVAPLPAHVSTLVQTNDLKTVEQLRTELAQITHRNGC